MWFLKKLCTYAGQTLIDPVRVIQLQFSVGKFERSQFPCVVCLSPRRAEHFLFDGDIQCSVKEFVFS